MMRRYRCSNTNSLPESSDLNHHFWAVCSIHQQISRLRHRCHTSIPYVRRHLIRFTTTRWDTITRVTKFIHLNQLATCKNTVRFWANPILQRHSTLRMRKTNPKYLHYHSGDRGKPTTYLNLLTVAQHRPHTPGQTTSCVSKYQCHYSHMKIGRFP